MWVQHYPGLRYSRTLPLNEKYLQPPQENIRFTAVEETEWDCNSLPMSTQTKWFTLLHWRDRKMVTCRKVDFSSNRNRINALRKLKICPIFTPAHGNTNFHTWKYQFPLAQSMIPKLFHLLRKIQLIGWFRLKKKIFFYNVNLHFYKRKGQISTWQFKSHPR